jgi:hypothetical protein
VVRCEREPVVSSAWLPKAMNSTLAVAATSLTATVTLEVRVPVRKSTWSRSMSFFAFWTPMPGFEGASSVIISILRPRTPPLAFHSSLASCAPSISSRPESAYGPLSGSMLPIRIGPVPWAHARFGTRMVGPAAAAMTPPPRTFTNSRLESELLFFFAMTSSSFIPVATRARRAAAAAGQGR